MEPAALGSKLRYEIVRIIGGSGKTTPIKLPSETKETTEITESSIDKERKMATVSRQSSYCRYHTITYKMGVYLEDSSTLKDLRNTFIDSGQLEAESQFFKFLYSDLPGDYVEIDSEEGKTLSSLASRTVYIEAVDSGKHLGQTVQHAPYSKTQKLIRKIRFLRSLSAESCMCTECIMCICTC